MHKEKDLDGRNRGGESGYQNNFERPQGTQKDVAELDVLRNCACSFLQHEPLSMGENVLAASDVTRFYSGHRRYLLSTRNSDLACGK